MNLKKQERPAQREGSGPHEPTRPPCTHHVHGLAIKWFQKAWEEVSSVLNRADNLSRPCL